MYDNLELVSKVGAKKALKLRIDKITLVENALG